MKYLYIYSIYIYTVYSPQPSSKKAPSSDLNSTTLKEAFWRVPLCPVSRAQRSMENLGVSNTLPGISLKWKLTPWNFHAPPAAPVVFHFHDDSRVVYYKNKQRETINHHSKGGFGRKHWMTQFANACRT